MKPDTAAFRSIILDYYQENKRDFPWRTTTNPYNILVSEIMLQQTQVSRVVKKYGEFISAFPDFKSLYNAPLDKALLVWQGMGYNRRLLCLKKIAAKVVEEYGGLLPEDPEVLETFPGIGKNTAGSIAAFAFNKPTVFIETNIRTVFIFFFFKDREKVVDSEILPLVKEYLFKEQPCTWYNALMDYGVMLKAKEIDINKKSIHYAKQKPFSGSLRELRGKIIKRIAGSGPLSLYDLAFLINETEEKTLSVAEKLSAEGFFTIRQGKIIIHPTEARSEHDTD